MNINDLPKMPVPAGLSPSRKQEKPSGDAAQKNTAKTTKEKKQPRKQSSQPQQQKVYQKKDVKASDAAQPAASAQAETQNANPFSFNMNVNATVFVPKDDSKPDDKPKANEKKEPQKKVEEPKPAQNTIKKEGSFDFGGYKNPYQATIDIEKEKKKQLDKELEEEKSKTYSIDFIMSLREDNKLRPANMAFLILPHKKRQVNLPKNPSQVSPEQEEF